MSDSQKTDRPEVVDEPNRSLLPRVVRVVSRIPATVSLVLLVLGAGVASQQEDIAATGANRRACGRR